MEKEKETPELSVIVPVYNVESYLPRCLNSILTQPYDNLEVICVDDGSTDDSLRILHDYKERDERVRVLQKENGGLVSARKAGIQIARGKYVSIVDSDDWIEKNMYEELMQIAEQTDADIITSGCIRDYGTSTFELYENVEPGLYTQEKLTDKLLTNMIDTEEFYRTNILMSLWSKIYRRELYSTHQCKVPDCISIGEDVACVLPCLLDAQRVFVSGKCYYHYCIRNDSLMGKLDMGSWEQHVRLFQFIDQEYEKIGKRVCGIRKQYRYLEMYNRLLRYPDKGFSYENNILFPFGELRKEDKVIIYGAGRFGSSLMNYMQQEKCCEIVAWVDRTPREGINDCSVLEELKWDKIIIAVLLADVVKQIKEDLQKRAIEMDKIYSVNMELVESSL